MANENEAPRGKPGEIVVFMVRRETQCSECGEELGKGNLLRLENEKALCIECADLDHLEFLPSGDAAVTRRATKYSRMKVVVVEWSRRRKRYERQGILATTEAIERAEQECEADAEQRAMRQERAAERRAVEDREYITVFARALREQYPGCPAGAETRIAEHACTKYSGRVGRTAAAKELDADAIRLAVIAHIRHEHTNYDELLGRFGDRRTARDAIRDRVAVILRRWEQGTG